MYNWGGWTNCNEFDAGGDKKTKFYCVRAKHPPELCQEGLLSQLIMLSNCGSFCAVLAW